MDEHVTWVKYFLSCAASGTSVTREPESWGDDWHFVTCGAYQIYGFNHLLDTPQIFHLPVSDLTHHSTSVFRYLANTQRQESCDGLEQNYPLRKYGCQDPI